MSARYHFVLCSIISLVVQNEWYGRAARKVLSRPLNRVVNRLFRIRNLNLAFRVVLWYSAMLFFWIICFLDDKVAVMFWKVCFFFCAVCITSDRFGVKKKLWENQNNRYLAEKSWDYICNVAKTFRIWILFALQKLIDWSEIWFFFGSTLASPSSVTV